jgi:hypothetical protein
VVFRLVDFDVLKGHFSGISLDDYSYGRLRHSFEYAEKIPLVLVLGLSSGVHLRCREIPHVQIPDIFLSPLQGIDDCRVPKKNKPRRVDVFWSSWRIRPTLAKDGSGMAACEVILTHWEEMGIQRDVAKLGVKQGMWNAVRKIEPGVSKYAVDRAAGRPLSRAASFANITTRIRTDSSSEDSPRNSPRLPSPGPENGGPEFTEEQQKGGRGKLGLVLMAGGAMLAFGVPVVGQVAGAGLVMKTVKKVRNRG